MKAIELEILSWTKAVDGLRAFNTTRGNASEDDFYSEINLCDYTNDNIAHVAACRDALCNQLDIPMDHLVMPRQTHTTNVAVVDEALMALSQPKRMDKLQNIDALVTKLKGVCIGVNTADCVNISLVDPEAGIIGVAHAGWRGTVGRIAKNTVDTMVTLGAKPERIMAVMGASICQECFEVGDEVVAAFAKSGFDMDTICYRNAETGKGHINLQKANEQVLQEAGLKAENITWSGSCSRCNPQRFFSARRLGINSGRTFTGIIQK